jgi:branched-chain amino acid transport system ATP-binding protein
MSYLEVSDLDKHFGGLQVISDLSFVVDEQEIIRIIGPNGAGKSTTLNLITGVNSPDEGDIRFQGQSLLGMQPHKITGMGIARTFQTLRVFLNVSVIENVMSAAYHQTKGTILARIGFAPRPRKP